MRSLPCFMAFISRSTSLPVEGEYLRPELFFAPVFFALVFFEVDLVEPDLVELLFPDLVELLFLAELLFLVAPPRVEDFFAELFFGLLLRAEVVLRALVLLRLEVVFLAFVFLRAPEDFFTEDFFAADFFLVLDDFLLAAFLVAINYPPSKSDDQGFRDSCMNVKEVE